VFGSRYVSRHMRELAIEMMRGRHADGGASP
jgi:hypothetical protein